jgi:crotonobetainyl-CoA:carnitine CoA-transferase CaiB-like acyl-CoA transferase
VAELRAAGVPVEPVIEASRGEFVDMFLDDAVNRQLGQVVSHHWGKLGLVEQLRLPLRLGPGPVPVPTATLGLPALGEHTAQVLGTVGFDTAQRTALAASGTVLVPRES